MNIEFEKVLSCSHVVDILNDMIGIVYDMKRKGVRISYVV